MKRLVSTTGLSKTEWLKYRKQGITGTDAGAITGMNPFMSAFQVYQDKISSETVLFDNEAMRQGRDFENYVASRFEEETGLKVRKANAIYQNEQHPIMLADFDRLITGQRSGLECKTVNPYSADKWKNGSIPLHYQMQIQHYLAVSGYDSWYICALIFGKELIIRKIDRDEELIKDLITVEEHFWNDYVVKGIMPDPDGSQNCSEFILGLYSKADGEKSVALTGFNGMLTRRSEIDELIGKLEAEKNTIDQKIKLKLGDASLGITEDYRVSWKNFEQNRLDTTKLKSERPDIYDVYCKKSSGRRFTVTPAA